MSEWNNLGCKYYDGRKHSEKGNQEWGGKNKGSKKLLQEGNLWVLSNKDQVLEATGEQVTWAENNYMCKGL